MTRVQIAYEGREVVPGQLLQVGALKWDAEKRIFIFPGQNWSALPLGEVTDIRREDDGWITAELGDFEMPAGAAVTVWANEVVGDPKVKPWVVESAQIRGVFITAEVPWAANYEEK